MRYFCYSLLLLLILSANVDDVCARTHNKNSIFKNPFAKKQKNLLETISEKIIPHDNKKKNKHHHHDHHKATTKQPATANKGKNKKDTLLYTTQNLLAGLASAIALIPEASTFAMGAGLNPLVGLGSTIVLATICGSIGGRPGLVSGASATVSMILKPLCDTDGHLAVSLAVILAGILQIGLGKTKCGKYIRVIPRPVMLGFVNGLSIKVVKAQIPHFQDHHSGAWLPPQEMKWHCLLVIASALIIDFLPRWTTLVPSPLAALALLAICANVFDLPVPRLVDMVGPETFQGGINTLQQALFPFINHQDSNPNTPAAGLLGGLLPPFQTIELSQEKMIRIVSTAVEMALVGLLQSLLTLQIVDEKTHKRRGKNTKESIAQGIGNVVSGFMGGMGGSALLGQSLVNVNSGGTGRLSSIAVAGFVMCGVTLFAPLLGGLPVAALVGLMFTVAQHTFSWDFMNDVIKGKVPLADIFIIVLVSWTTAFQSMVAAVTLGVLASALRFAWQASCNLTAQETGRGGMGLNSRYIRVKGQLFFASSSTFQKLCEPSSNDREIAKLYRKRLANRLKNKQQQQQKANKDGSSSASILPEPETIRTGRETVIDFFDSQVWDHAAMMAIESVAQQYHDLGVQLYLRHLSPDCREKLLESSNLGDLSTDLVIDQGNDPTYLVGEDPKYWK